MDHRVTRSQRSPRATGQQPQQSPMDRLAQLAAGRHRDRAARASDAAANVDARLDSSAAATGTRRSIGAPSSASARRSLELAQSVRQRRSLFGQMSSAQSSVAAASIPPLTALAPKVDNRPALVIEVGTRLTRIGFAGEYTPREIFHSEWVDPLEGPRGSAPVPVFDRTRSAQAQHEVLVKFLKNIVFRKLLTTVNSRRVVWVESLLAPEWQRQAIARTLFECPSLRAHSVLFAPSHLLCSFPFNARTCLVLDLGAEEAVLFPMAEGVLMLNSWETSSAPCATALERNVRQLMRKYGRVRSGDDDPEGRPLDERDMARGDAMGLWEDVAVRFCFATTAARGKRIRAHMSDPDAHPFDDPAPSVHLQFGAAHLLVVPGLVREGAPEVLFAHSNEPDGRSVAQLVLDSVVKASIDLRREFLRNLLLVGGVTRMPGFLARLKSELLSAIADGYHPKLVPQLHDIRFYQFPAELKGQLFCAWLGGAMFSAYSENVDQRSLTRQDWLSTKRVPDWTSPIDAHFAKFEDGEQPKNGGQKGPKTADQQQNHELSQLHESSSHNLSAIAEKRIEKAI